MFTQRDVFVIVTLIKQFIINVFAMKALMVSVIIRAIQVAFVINHSPNRLPFCYRIATNQRNNQQAT